MNDRELAIALRAEGLTPSQIAKKLDTPIDQVQEWVGARRATKATREQFVALVRNNPHLKTCTAVRVFYALTGVKLHYETAWRWRKLLPSISESVIICSPAESRPT